MPEHPAALEPERLVVLGAARPADGAEPVDAVLAHAECADAYLRAVHAVHLLLDADRSVVPRDLRRATLAVQRLVDLHERDGETLVALHQLGGIGDFRAAHGAATAVLAIAVGRLTGLDRNLLASTALAGLVHETGPAALRLLQETVGSADDALRAALAIPRLREPPATASGRRAPLTHRILAAACFYHAASTPGPVAGRTPRAEDVLRAMAAAEHRFDATVVRALASVVGRYPVGTVVELDTGECAIVCGRNPHFEASGRPIVRVVAEADGSTPDEPRVIDLSLWDRRRKRFAHSIVASQHPAEAVRDAGSQLVALGAWRASG